MLVVGPLASQYFVCKIHVLPYFHYIAAGVSIALARHINQGIYPSRLAVINCTVMMSWHKSIIIYRWLNIQIKKHPLSILQHVFSTKNTLHCVSLLLFYHQSGDMVAVTNHTFKYKTTYQSVGDNTEIRNKEITWNTYDQ